jgi:hypothetical protein
MLTEADRLRRIIYQRDDRIRSLQRENLSLTNQVERLKPLSPKYDMLWSDYQDLKFLYDNQATVISLLLEEIQLTPKQKVALNQKYQYVR